MPEKSEKIESKYLSGAPETTGGVPPSPPSEELDVKRYGTGKPERRVIRAKITNGNTD
jgi:hypothetical protein